MKRSLLAFFILLFGITRASSATVIYEFSASAPSSTTASGIAFDVFGSETPSLSGRIMVRSGFSGIGGTSDPRLERFIYFYDELVITIGTQTFNYVPAASLNVDIDLTVTNAFPEGDGAGDIANDRFEFSRAGSQAGETNAFAPVSSIGVNFDAIFDGPDVLDTALTLPDADVINSAQSRSFSLRFSIFDASASPSNDIIQGLWIYDDVVFSTPAMDGEPVVPVPLPACFAFMGLGLAGLGLVRRRR